MRTTALPRAPSANESTEAAHGAVLEDTAAGAVGAAVDGHDLVVGGQHRTLPRHTERQPEADTRRSSAQRDLLAVLDLDVEAVEQAGSIAGELSVHDASQRVGDHEPTDVCLATGVQHLHQREIAFLHADAESDVLGRDFLVVRLRAGTL